MAPPPFPHQERTSGSPSLSNFQSLLPGSIQGCISVSLCHPHFPSLCLPSFHSSPRTASSGASPALGNPPQARPGRSRRPRGEQTPQVVPEAQAADSWNYKADRDPCFLLFEAGDLERDPLTLPRSRKPVLSSSHRNCFFLDVK